MLFETINFEGKSPIPIHSYFAIFDTHSVSILQVIIQPTGT